MIEICIIFHHATKRTKHYIVTKGDTVDVLNQHINRERKIRISATIVTDKGIQYNFSSHDQHETKNKTLYCNRRRLSPMGNRYLLQEAQISSPGFVKAKKKKKRPSKIR